MVQSYEKSRAEQKKLVYFLCRDGVTYSKLRLNEQKTKTFWVFSNVSKFGRARVTKNREKCTIQTSSGQNLLKACFSLNFRSTWSVQQHVKERLRVSHLSRGNNRHTPLRGFRKKTHSHADNPTIKAVTDASIYPTKIQKIFETTKFFMPEMTRFLPGFASLFVFDFLVYISATFVTLSHCHIGGILAYDVCCHAVDGLQAQPWFHQKRYLSHCHIVAVRRSNRSPLQPQPPPSPPKGGELKPAWEQLTVKSE